MRPAPFNRRRQGMSRRRAGVSTLEFVIVLPLFLLLVTFIVDISRVLMASNAVDMATARAAREAAIVGGGSVNCGSTPCFRSVFDEVVSVTPGAGEVEKISNVRATTGRRCSVADSVVTIEATYSIDFLTPGLASVMGLGSADGFRGLTSVGVARCEVAYAP